MGELNLPLITDNRIRAERNSYNDAFYTAREFNAYKAIAKLQRDRDREIAEDLYGALEAWDELRAMHPLDSGTDIDEIFWRCCEITDKALAKAEGKGVNQDKQ